ncbi:MAG: hypothetical protein L6R38_004755, partial [Xanthoria sp. 2 TBL-2021]
FTGLIDSLKFIDRLTYIRHVELYLWHEDHYSFVSSKREKWRRFVNARSGERAIELPAVSDLVLDFGAMELEAGNFGVSPIIEKFRTSNGLRRLKVVGLRKESRLKKLREGLVGEGGKFEVAL